MPSFASRSRLGPSVRCLIAAVLATGCAAHGPRVPGPLGAVGKDPPPVAILRPHEAFELSEAPEADDEPPTPRRRHTDLGDRIADAALHWVDHRPRGFRDDCSGFVMAALDRAGVPMSGSTASFWDDARDRGITHSRKRPTVGDLVFFDNTYDRNRNGRWDDDLTHIGIVVEVDRQGTITVAHGGTSKGRTTMVMNLTDPSARHADDGQELNDWLRAKRNNDPKRASYLSGELFRGFATLDDERVAGNP